ncbi:hypothetical protein KCV03_g279, partial [Aureobasidium melanogenum]
MARFANECRLSREALTTLDSKRPINLWRMANCSDALVSPQRLTNFVSRVNTTGVSRGQIQSLVPRFLSAWKLLQETGPSENQSHSKCSSWNSTTESSLNKALTLSHPYHFSSPARLKIFSSLPISY